MEMPIMKMIKSHVIIVHIRGHGCGSTSRLFQFNRIHAIYAPITPNNAPDAPTDTDVGEPTEDSNVA